MHTSFICCTFFEMFTAHLTAKLEQTIYIKGNFCLPLITQMKIILGNLFPEDKITALGKVFIVGVILNKFPTTSIVDDMLPAKIAKRSYNVTKHLLFHN